MAAPVELCKESDTIEHVAHAYTHTRRVMGPERIYHLAPEPGREVCLGGWKVEGRMETASCPPRAEVAGPRGVACWT